MTNLLPKQQKIAILGMYRKRYVTLALFALAALGLAAMFLLLPSYLYLRSSQIVLTTKRDALASYASTAAATALAATVTKINGQLAVFPDVDSSSPIVAGLINPILAAKDPTIHITEFDFAPGASALLGKVTVVGTADSRTDLLAFAEKVRALGPFSTSMLWVL